MRYVSKKSALITQLVSLPIEGTKTAVLRRELLSFPSFLVNELRSSLSCVFSDTSSSEDELALTRKSCQQNNILASPTRRNRVMIDNKLNAVAVCSYRYLRINEGQVRQLLLFP